MSAGAAARAGDGGMWDDQSHMADAILGQGLSPRAHWHLQQAGLSYQQDNVAESHLQWARTLEPDHMAVLIGLYRYYFYKGRLTSALAVAIQCLDRAMMDLNLSGDWRQIAPGDADFGDMGAVVARFLLFTLKGYAYLNMRLGDLAQGQVALGKLMELDPQDKLGWSVLVGVLDRMGQDEDE